MANQKQVALKIAIWNKTASSGIEMPALDCNSMYAVGDDPIFELMITFNNPGN